MSRLEVKKVQLSDKTWMDAYLDAKQDKGCDMCFANIYLWGRKYKTGYAMVNDCLIFADLMDFNSVSMPLGEPEKVKQAILTLEEYFAEDGKPFALHLTTPKNVEQLEEWFPGKYQVEYERDLADYVYEREKLVALSGKKYHGKKNHVNKFKNLYPNWVYAEHQLRQGRAVHAAALLLEDLQDDRVWQSLDGKILLEAFVPAECLVDAAGIFTDALLIVDMERRGHILNDLLCHRLGQKRFLFHSNIPLKFLYHKVRVIVVRTPSVFASQSHLPPRGRLLAVR